MKLTQPVDLKTRANAFARKLSQCCEGVVDFTGRDETALAMVSVLYMWLYEKSYITMETPFTVICNMINSVAIHFFTLDMSECSDMTLQRYTNLRNMQLSQLSRDRSSVLSDFQVIFDLTCTGELLGVEFDY